MGFHSAYQIQQALQNPETAATVIHAIVREHYGEEAYGWDPVTISMELQADFGAEVCSEVIDRWCAVATVMTSDAVFKRVDAFLGICHTLNTGDPAFDVFDPVSVEEIAWAVAEIALNREILPFSYAVQSYVKRMLRQDGYQEGEWPEILSEMFERTPDATDIRDALQNSKRNEDNISQYIDEQLKDLCYQFGKIPDLKGVEGILMERGFEEAIAAIPGVPG